jgi:DNA-binding NtrC family response regulator
MLLFRHYLQRAAETHGTSAPDIDPDAAQLLLAYTWPGNVRELRNVTERLALHDLRRPIAPDDLPSDILSRLTAPAPAAPKSGTVPAAGMPAFGVPASPAVPPAPVNAIVERAWERLMSGEEFWTAVQQPFRAHELTRADLAALVDRGLQSTHGSYRALVRLFNMPAEDYKRFHAFLYQQNCNLPVGPYRNAAGNRPRVAAAAAPAAYAAC